MKKYIDILSLWVRMTFWGGVLIVAATAGVQLYLAWVELGDVPRSDPTFNWVVSGADWNLVWIAGFLTLTLWLAFVPARASSMTLARLNVGERAAALLLAGVGLGWYLILWGTETLTAVVTFRMFLGRINPGAVSGQSLFISCFTNGFLHSLLPLSDTLAWIAQMLAFAALALTSAVGCLRRWRGRRYDLLALPMPFWVCFSVLLLDEGSEAGSPGISGVTLAASLLLIALDVWRLSRKEREPQ